jgi:hypothetical protein
MIEYVAVVSQGYCKGGFADAGQAVESGQNEAAVVAESLLEQAQQVIATDETGNARWWERNSRVVYGRRWASGRRLLRQRLLSGCFGTFSRFITFLWKEAEISSIFAKERTELAAIVGTGEGCAPLPATQIVVIGPNLLGNVLLGPSSQFAFVFQYLIRSCLGGFFHGFQTGLY